MNEIFLCCRCGQEHPVTDRFVFDGQELCQNCYESETRICGHCGKRIWADEDYGDAGLILCRTCEERYYERCVDCGRLVELGLLHYLEDDDENGYCDICYDRMTSEAGDHSYSYKPEPVF